MSDNKGSKDGRARAWTFIVYPDSAPENWRDILDSKCIPWVESPLHDPDPSAPPEEARKKHYHIVLSFEGKKSQDQIKDIIKELNCTAPQVVHNLRSLVRYFLHLDQPNKQQFALNDIIEHCGIDIKDYLTNRSDKYYYIKCMCNFVLDQGIIEFHDLVSYAMEYEPEWFECLCDNSSFIMNLFIKSYRHDPAKTAPALEDKPLDGECKEV